MSEPREGDWLEPDFAPGSFSACPVCGHLHYVMAPYHCEGPPVPRPGDAAFIGPHAPGCGCTACRLRRMDVVAAATTAMVLARQRGNRSDEDALRRCHDADVRMSRRSDRRKASAAPLKSEAEVFAGFEEKSHG